MTAEMAAIEKKDSLKLTATATEKRAKYNSKIPKVTWPPPQLDKSFLYLF